MVEKVAVMLSRSVDVLPSDGPWAYEPKLDGFRCLLSISEFGDVCLESRRAKPLGRYFPEVVAAARLLPPGLALDGEPAPTSAATSRGETVPSVPPSSGLCNVSKSRVLERVVGPRQV